MCSVSRSPSTLRTLAKTSVRKTYCRHWDFIKNIPKGLQRELLFDWLNNFDILSDTQSDADIFFIFDSWQDIKENMCTALFVRIMIHPFAVPSWVYEKNYVVGKFIDWTSLTPTVQTRSLCELCFKQMSMIDEPWHGNYWSEKQWFFRRRHSHDIIDGDEMLSVVWYIKNWCSHCITTSLIDIHEKHHYECNHSGLFHENYSDYWESQNITPSFVSDDEWHRVKHSLL
jgi:hypothetical protein